VEAFGLEPATPLFSRYLADDPFFVHHTFEEYAKDSTANQFEVIFASDVIEHVERPDLLLRDASVLLRPGGTLFVSTPDVRSVFALIFGKRWHFYNRYHLSYLSRRTIATMAARYGLREVGFAHLSKQKSVGYALQYLADFIVGAGRIRVPDRLDKFLVSLNLFDTMSVVFQKTPNSTTTNNLEATDRLTNRSNGPSQAPAG
jgi:SAM-dependent methyltransferase